MRNLMNGRVEIFIDRVVICGLTVPRPNDIPISHWEDFWKGANEAEEIEGKLESNSEEIEELKETVNNQKTVIGSMSKKLTKISKDAAAISQAALEGVE